MIPKLTSSGISLMIRALHEEGITFTKIAIGSGQPPADYKKLTKLQNQLFSMEISEITKKDEYVVLKATMNNADMTTGYYWTELGVFAANPDGGSDLLYAYAHFALSGDDSAIYIPKAASSLVEITHTVHVYVGELDNVTAILTPSGSDGVSAAELKAHTSDFNNPHKVTKQALGLDKVENLALGDQMPTFEMSASPHSYDKDSHTWDFTNIFSGEKMGNILRKVRTAITLLIDHLNEENPHLVNARQIGIQSGRVEIPLESAGRDAVWVDFPKAYATGTKPSVVVSPYGEILYWVENADGAAEPQINTASTASTVRIPYGLVHITKITEAGFAILLPNAYASSSTSTINSISISWIACAT